ncbi:4-hydroxybenzoate octaprenyltransferase [Acidomonas methanolica]|uniref:4-hydroxybenzoate octaprenyltransferase n=1 Tax=Acidomonas methanolica NBRC 104435 TaxID=1231351 RepID=A0A023D3T0_ACIMT|nr:4-hydroxybenzoate octaprenyltransferase [Acidomonas methanolica]MBU2653616.1 4-hydroxybenzoate octaprenyltransferase [Acidomonas methanolica]TCS31567.1 4-hydroxybenzoate polyprenyltransferase [Acidomonas methanolica]GAJ28782.1 4-hydroxybenzoate polyprenyl transferase [Acidomonas methanolica NBRC 104435]GBQ56137.1 4-hydroxybenzoate polyprenyltransferase [Acidomonas methanolica]GEK97986.1 4-hydroxybenzoate octaprenyltransferase [Acidomonas methanolica NBRC 104435]
MTPVALPHSDIHAEGWISRLPPGFRPYALLARLDRPVGTWLLLLPGIWGIILGAPGDLRRQIGLSILFAVGSLVMRSAGCVINDIWDRDIDAQVARTAGRPLASGALTVRQALAALALLLLAGLAVLLCLPPLCWALAPLAMALVILYPLAKRVTWWPQLVMGFTFGFGAPMGYAAAADRIDSVLLLLYGGTILWQLGFDTIYGFQDMEDDARIGVRSTSRLMRDHAKLFIALCYAGAVTLFALAGWKSEEGPGFWLGGTFAALMLARQIVLLDPGQPRLCLTLFRQNVPFGMVLALALLAGQLVRG